MNKSKKEWLIRHSAFFLGLIIMAFGIVLTIKADLGVAPWDVLHIGLYYQFGLTIGSWSIILGIFILAISSFIMKSWPKYGSFLNMLLVGIFIDFFMLLPFLQTPQLFLGKLFMLFIGIVILAFGMGMYISGSIGAGPRDSLMLAFHLKMGWKVQNVRLVMEVSVLIVGFLLGGPVSIGTLIVTVALSYLAGFMIPFCRTITEQLVATVSLQPKQAVNTKDIA